MKNHPITHLVSEVLFFTFTLLTFLSFNCYLLILFICSSAYPPSSLLITFSSHVLLYHPLSILPFIHLSFHRLITIHSLLISIHPMFHHSSTFLIHPCIPSSTSFYYPIHHLPFICPSLFILTHFFSSLSLLNHIIIPLITTSSIPSFF